ncbi:hypothetical protein WA158_000727 [Blastocystis sp. Blastoise]
MSKTLTFAMCQMTVGSNKAENLQHAKSMIQQAVASKAQMVILPECFNSTYNTAEFPKNAEMIPSDAKNIDPVLSPSIYMLKEEAIKNKVFLIGGSIPEKEIIRDKTYIYNTCPVFDPEGNLLCKHRKIHLFDISIPGKQVFKESDTLTAGNSITTFNSPWGLIGLGICYDIRFPELSMLMAKKGCKLLCFPSAFNTTTGPLHWNILARARAVDNQLFVTMVSPARNMNADYHAYGHSICVSPWGKILKEAEVKEDIVLCTIDFEEVNDIRNSIPILKQKRNDLYELKEN